MVELVLLKGPLSKLGKCNIFVMTCVNLHLPVLDLVWLAVLSRGGAQLLFRLLPSTFFFVNPMKVNAFIIQVSVVQ